MAGATVEADRGRGAGQARSKSRGEWDGSLLDASRGVPNDGPLISNGDLVERAESAPLRETDRRGGLGSAVCHAETRRPRRTALRVERLIPMRRSSPSTTPKGRTLGSACSL